MILAEKTKEKFAYDPFVHKGNKTKYCFVKCDICGEEIQKQLYLILRQRKKIELDTCGSRLCTKEKTRRTNLLIYGVESTNQLEEVKRKKKMYGADNPMHKDGVKEKIKQTTLKRYGVDHPHKSKEVRDKYEKTMFERYGCKSAVERPDVRERAKKALKQKKTIAKRNKTMKEKYGVENVAHLNDAQERRSKTNLKKYGNTVPMNADQIRKEEWYQRKRLSFAEIVEACRSKNYQPLFDYEGYTNKNQVLKFKCNIHDIEFVSKLAYVKLSPSPQCPKCRNYNSSKGEQEIREYVAELVGEENLISHERSIGQHEIDVYVPSKNVGIEYHGLYWHCELQKPDKYHYEKFLDAKSNDIQLIQFFEDEWRDRKDICKNIIKNVLGFSEKKFHARNLEVVFVESAKAKIGEDKQKKEAIKKFIETNHLQGNAQSSVYFALKEKGSSPHDANSYLLSLSLRKPFTKKHREDSLEIARVCSAPDVVVRGGFSKLFKRAKAWAKEKGKKKILTYSDCRYSWGKIYENNGFFFSSHTGLDYFYTDFCKREGRFKYRAQPGKPEIMVAIENDVYKIFGAGHFCWVCIV